MARRGRAAAAVVGLTVALSGCWPAPGQGPDRQSWNPLETAIDVDDVDTLTEVWTSPVGWLRPGEFPLFFPEPAAHPIVSNVGLVTVTTKSSIAAFDAETGTRQWIQNDNPPTGYDFDTDVVAVGDAVAVGHGNNRYGWSTWERDARTGMSTGDSWPILGKGLSVRGRRAVGLRPGHGMALGDQVVWLYFGDLDDAAAAWSGQVSTVWEPPARVTLGADRVFHSGPGLLTSTPGDGTHVNGLRSFPVTDPPKGCGPVDEPYYLCPQWVAPLDGAGATAPILSTDGATAYTVTDVGTAYAVDTATGAILWSTPVGSAVATTPALAEGVLFVPTASGALVVLDAEDGSVRWSTPTGSELTVQPAVAGEGAGGVVITGAADGTVRAFASAGCGEATCSDVWSDATGSRITGAPAVSLGKLFVGTEDGRLIAYAPSAAGG